MDQLNLTPIDSNNKKLDLVPLNLEPVEPSADELINEAKKSIVTPTTKKTEEPKKSDEGILSRAWKVVSEPLTDAPSRFASTVANYIDTPKLDENPILRNVKAFGAGATKGLGDIASSLTSPINLAMAVASGGESVADKAGLSEIANILRYGTKAMSVPFGIEGVHKIWDADNFADVGTGVAEIAGSIAGMHSSPHVSPGLEEFHPIIKNDLPLRESTSVRTPDLMDDFIKSVEGPVLEGKPWIGANDEVIGHTTDNNGSTGLKPVDTFSKQVLPKDDWTNAFRKEPSSTKLDLEPIESTPAEPTQKLGQPNILVQASKATPELIKKAREKGYEFAGLNDEGNFRFKKSNTPSESQPILENEVGETRPTRQKLGPDIDSKKGNIPAEIMNFPRTMMASMDMSAPLRQGIGLIHKPEFWKAIPQMVKAWGSEAAYEQIQQSIADKPLFKTRIVDRKEIPSFAQDAGLKLTDLHDLSNREERLMSTWAEKIPGIRASERSYTAFLNKLRADTFESLVNQGKVFGVDGTTNIPLARGLADFVNTATGRGSLGKLESSAVALNSVFFAPRLIASRLQMMNPMYYITADPMVRREALKSLFAIAGTGNAVGQLARMSGLGTVESDPTSSDFGKIKIGNIRIDPFAGFQQYIVAANRLVQGRMKSSVSGNEYNLGEKFGRPTRLDILGKFAESKLNPVLSFATAFLRGKDFVGQPFNVKNEIAQRFVPILLQDVKQLATEDPSLISGYNKLHLKNLPYVIPSWFGMGVQQYESR